MSYQYDSSNRYQQHQAPPYGSNNHDSFGSGDQARPHLRPALTDLNDKVYDQSTNQATADSSVGSPPRYPSADRPPYDGPISPLTPGIPGMNPNTSLNYGSLNRRTLPVPPPDTAGMRISSMNGRRPLPAPPPGGAVPAPLSGMDFGPPLAGKDSKTLPSRPVVHATASDASKALTTSRRPLPTNPPVNLPVPLVPPAMPSVNSYYNMPIPGYDTSLSLPSPSPYPPVLPPSLGTPHYPGFSLPNPLYGAPIMPNGMMFPPTNGSLPPHLSMGLGPPFVGPPGQGFMPPGYLQSPMAGALPPGYSLGSGQGGVVSLNEKEGYVADEEVSSISAGRKADEEHLGDGGQVTPRPGDRAVGRDYFGAAQSPTTVGSSPAQFVGATVEPKKKTFGQTFLAGLSVQDSPEAYSPSIVDSYSQSNSQSHAESQRYESSEAPLLFTSSLTSEGDANWTQGDAASHNLPYNTVYESGQPGTAYRDSVVSLPQSVRTFGEGPSNGTRHGRQQSLNHRGSLAPSWMEQSQEGRPPPARWVQNKLFLHQSHAAGFSPTSLGDATGEDGEAGGYFEEEYEEEYEEEEEVEEQNEMNFFSPSLLSHVSVQLRDRVERNSHIKGGIPWPKSFTGRDIITTIQSFMPEYTRISGNDRRFAATVAHSLQKQLLFVEVDWDDKPLSDSVEDVYQFMNEIEGLLGSTYEFPTGVETMATKCYSPSCQGAGGCYSPMCPFKISPETFLSTATKASSTSQTSTVVKESRHETWSRRVDQALIDQMSETEKKRQNIIYQAIQAEEQYEADLNAVETLFISPLRLAQPPVIRSLKDLEDLISTLFGNILELRAANASLLEFFTERQREQGGVISTIGDVYLTAAAEFRNLYPDYIGRLPRAEERLREELANNSNFRFFVDRVVRTNENRRMDIKYLITRPATQLNRYPQILEAILSETSDDSPDATFLVEAIKAIRNLSLTAQLKVWQASANREEVPVTDDALVQRERVAHQANMLDKPWSEFVAVEDIAVMSEDEMKVQHTIWELIQGEMTYVADLRVIESVYIEGLRSADEPIVDRLRLEIFLDDVFHNYRSLLDIHTDLLEKLHARQEEQHPRIGAISDLIYDAALRWQDAIIEYGSHYPKAKYAWELEKRTNPKFAAFLDRCRNTSGTNRQDIGHFAYRPVPRLLRYTLLLKDIQKHLSRSEQLDNLDIATIPEVIDLIDSQGKMIEKGVEESSAKVSLWQLPDSLSGGKFGNEIIQDLDLTNPMRELVHKGRLLRQPEGSIAASWSELHALLFNNFFVLTKLGKSKTSQNLPPRYYINRKPIPLELLTLGSFADPPQSRRVGLLRNFRSERHENGATQNSDSESRTVYPFTFSFMGSGQLGGQYTLWADSEASRKDWQQKLLHAKALRSADIEANKIFEMNALALDTFYASSLYGASAGVRAEDLQSFTGRVTCSVPFRTVDNRELVAIGCFEGVWIGLRSDPRSLRKVLHVKAVTQCAVLEQFSLFLVLSNKTLLAYPMESLVPSSHSTGPPPRGHQKLSDKHEVQYFACGQLSGRTLVIYLRKKGLNSVFRCLEPITGREMDETRNRRAFTHFLNAKNDWFRVYKDFFVPSEAFHVHFLRNKLIVVCQKGFEIIDLTELNPGSIPVFDSARVKNDASLYALKSRCDAGAKPLGIFRSTESEFLLVYDSFGFFVDRHGYPNRDMRAIEWEGRPESVGFHPPYVVLFSAPFMEIRHISDARLLQIYCAKDLRCSWDGTSANPEHGVPVPGPMGYTEEMISPEARLHIVQRADASRGQRRNAISQDVYELCPTLLLNNPLRDLSSRDSTYFQPAPEVHYANGGPSNAYGYSPWT